jgi:hypothetical protein
MIFNLFVLGDRRQVIIVPPLNLPYQDFHEFDIFFGLWNCLHF